MAWNDLPPVLANDATTTLTTALTSSTSNTQFTVSSGAGFPTLDQGSFYATLSHSSVTGTEIIRVSYANSGLTPNNWIAERAVEGTTAQAWPIGTTLELSFTAEALTNLARQSGILFDPSNIDDDNKQFQFLVFHEYDPQGRPNIRSSSLTLKPIAWYASMEWMEDLSESLIYLQHQNGNPKRLVVSEEVWDGHNGDPRPEGNRPEGHMLTWDPVGQVVSRKPFQFAIQKSDTVNNEYERVQLPSNLNGFTLAAGGPFGGGIYLEHEESDASPNTDHWLVKIGVHNLNVGAIDWGDLAYAPPRLAELVELPAYRNTVGGFVQITSDATEAEGYPPSIGVLSFDGTDVKTMPLATVATSGDYGDLAGRPMLPTQTSDLTNDNGFITEDDNARVAIKRNGTAIGVLRAVNLIEGSGVSLSVTDDATGEEIDVTIAAAGGASVDVQTFTSTGTWTKPANAQTTSIICIGGGGGGGGAGRRAGGSASKGGAGGGGGGGYSKLEIPAALLGASESVVVGSGGNGGAATYADNGFGSPGTAGTGSTFGSWVGAGGGAGGQSSATGIAGAGGIGLQAGGGGGAGNNTAGGTGARSLTGASGGGGGGGQTSANVAAAGGAGGGEPTVTSALTTTGGGAAGGAVATAGANATDRNNGDPRGGRGGGGGGAGFGADAGSGGSGAFPGGGGGGGGLAENGFTAGSGGSGAPGTVIVITVCGDAV